MVKTFVFILRYFFSNLVDKWSHLHRNNPEKHGEINWRLTKRQSWAKTNGGSRQQRSSNLAMSDWQQLNLPPVWCRNETANQLPLCTSADVVVVKLLTEFKSVPRAKCTPRFVRGTPHPTPLWWKWWCRVGNVCVINVTFNFVAWLAGLRTRWVRLKRVLNGKLAKRSS